MCTFVIYIQNQFFFFAALSAYMALSSPSTQFTTTHKNISSFFFHQFTLIGPSSRYSFHALVVIAMESARKLYALSGAFFRTKSGVVLLFLTVVLCVINTVLNVYSTMLTREYLNALTSKKADAFYSAVLGFACLVAVYVPFIAFYNYILRVFAVTWRQWLLEKLCTHMLRRHYELFVLSPKKLENVDSRIVDDVQTVVRKY